MNTLAIISLVLAVISLGASAAAVVFALQRPQWLRDQDRRIVMLETEWEDVLDKIKKRGDRLSRERGILKKNEEESVTPLNQTNRRSQLWQMKRAKESNRA